MTEVTTTAVRASGAVLQYELVGAGPVLLLIHGGIADSAILKGVAGLLATRRTVVTYDRRGYGDSPLEGPLQEQSVALHADDAHRVLADVTHESGDVLGISSGAFIGIELAMRHPDQVRKVVAFEPPLVELLPDREWFHRDGQETYDTYKRDGAQAALARFTGMVQDGDGAEPAQAPPEEPSPETLAFMARMGSNADFFFEHEFRQFGDWLPDLGALRTAGERIVIGGGDASGAQPARRAADALAERLGTRVAEFPGDHGSGISTRPGEFADRLLAVLD